MIAKHYPRALALAAVFIFYTNLDGYLFSSDILPSTAPVYWVIAYFVLAIPLVFDRKLLSLILRSPLTWWCYGFLLISGIWLFFQASHSEIVWLGFGIRVSSVGFLVCLLVLLSRENAQLWARCALLVAVLLGVATNLFELFHPATFSPIVGR